MTIEELYQLNLNDPLSDIRDHLPILRRYAEQSKVCVEFGVRNGCSTSALLAGCDCVYSYDIEPNRLVVEIPEPKKWMFTQADTTKLLSIQSCDLLFIDTKHTATQVAEELKMAAHVRRWIAFHDTIRWGLLGEDGRHGILFAICDHIHCFPLWRICEKDDRGMGLLVIERVA